MRKSRFLEAVKLTQEVLDDFIFMCEARAKPGYFTRVGKNKLSFKTTILFMLNFVRKSLQYELDNFFEVIDKEKVAISKQGFTAARKKIKPEAFMYLFNMIADWFYEQGSYKTYMGYRLCAIDAAILEINNSKKLRDVYNSAKGTSVELARGMTSCIYDIENNIIVKALITKCTAPEREVATQLIEMLRKSGSKNDLLLFDRGYPSIDFFFYLMSVHTKFVIRIPNNYYKNKIDSTLADQTIRFEKQGSEITLRVIKFELDSGIEEILVTNLMDTSLDVKHFKSLYFKRWGIEVKYDELKNKLEIQKFTGDSKETIEQDFYASMFLANMVSLVKQEADELIEIEHSMKKLKHQYTVNINILIGKLKDKLLVILLETLEELRLIMYQKILKEVIRNKVPKRPGRKFIRRKSLKANKNCMNRKTCI
ncbi:IS4 family transposase [Anaerobacillus sp. CMMVII]|uniref:IS4 family transposase n=1 Tax=Anaerobacillus sp. CMMVII TaxID=2755588 RepID=UPI0021B78780|nr:IS4 family transposase [Anaerobacillus sp. CMMVII]MCT8137678.1 IS4 family transposase [Anaerobacillus sp. CMMVII]MCT8139191.1 IS4 family transposase [Anaerobacillus sp. CMMVII]